MEKNSTFFQTVRVDTQNKVFHLNIFCEEMTEIEGLMEESEKVVMLKTWKMKVKLFQN